MEPYRIDLSEDALAELERIRKFDRVRIRKLDPPLLAEYRLAVGEHRVFYDVHASERVVVVAAVRYKGRRTLKEVADGEDP